MINKSFNDNKPILSQSKIVRTFSIFLDSYFLPFFLAYHYLVQIRDQLLFAPDGAFYVDHLVPKGLFPRQYPCSRAKFDLVSQKLQKGGSRIFVMVMQESQFVHCLSTIKWLYVKSNLVGSSINPYLLFFKQWVDWIRCLRYYSNSQFERKDWIDTWNPILLLQFQTLKIIFTFQKLLITKSCWEYLLIFLSI